EDRVVLHQRVVQRGRRDVPAGEADDQDPALERDALGGPPEGLPAHRVVNDVGTAPVGDFLDDRHEVLAVPVHDHVRAEFPRHPPPRPPPPPPPPPPARRPRPPPRPGPPPPPRRGPPPPPPPRPPGAKAGAPRPPPRARRCSPNHPVWYVMWNGAASASSSAS